MRPSTALLVTSGLLLLLSACTAKQLSGKEAYELMLSTPVPADITDFQGSGTEAFPDYESKAYFTYHAEPGYFKRLMNYYGELKSGRFTKAVELVSCAEDGFPQDFSFWTDEKISIAGKTCYTGLYSPYIHYFVYDEQTHLVQHFVSGTRD